MFAHTLGICHNTEHRRQSLQGANGLLEKTDFTFAVVVTPIRAEHTRQEFAEPYPFTQATAVLATNVVSTRDTKQNSRTLAAVTRGVVCVALLVIRRVRLTHTCQHA